MGSSQSSIVTKLASNRALDVTEAMRLLRRQMPVISSFTDPRFFRAVLPPLGQLIGSENTLPEVQITALRELNFLALRPLNVAASDVAANLGVVVDEAISAPLINCLFSKVPGVPQAARGAILELAPSHSLFSATSFAMTLTSYLDASGDEPTKVRLLPDLWQSGSELCSALKPVYVSSLHVLLSLERSPHIKAQIIAEFRRILHEEPTVLDGALSTSLFVCLRQIISSHNHGDANVVVDFSYGCLMKLIPQRRSVLGPVLLRSFAEVADNALSSPSIAAQYLDINCVVIFNILETCNESSLPTINSICVNASRHFMAILNRRKKLEDVVLLRLSSSVLRFFTAVLRWNALPAFPNWNPSFYRALSSILISCLLSGVDSVASAGSTLLAQTASATNQYLQFFVGDFSLLFLIHVARLLHPAKLKFPAFAKQMLVMKEIEDEQSALKLSQEEYEKSKSNPSSSSSSNQQDANHNRNASGNASSSSPNANPPAAPLSRSSLFGDELTPGGPSPLLADILHSNSSLSSNTPKAPPSRPSSPEPSESELPCASILEALYSVPTTAERNHRQIKEMLGPEIAFLSDYPVSMVALNAGDDSEFGKFQVELWNALNVTRSALCHILLCLIHTRGRTQQQLVELLSLWYDRMSFSGHFILVDVLNKALMSILVKADGQAAPLIVGLTQNANSPTSTILRTSNPSSSSSFMPNNASSSSQAGSSSSSTVIGAINPTIKTNNSANSSPSSSSAALPTFPVGPGSPNPHAMQLTSTDRDNTELNRKIAEMEKELTRIATERAQLSAQLSEKSKTISTLSTEKEALLNQIACAVCFENILDNKPVCLECGHLFCGNCVANLTKTHKNCPLCKSQIGRIIQVKGL